MNKAIVLTRDDINFFDKDYNKYKVIIACLGSDLHPTLQKPIVPDADTLVIAGDKNSIYYHTIGIFRKNKNINTVWIIGHPCERSLITYLKEYCCNVNILENYYNHYFNRWFNKNDKNIRSISHNDLNIFLQKFDIEGLDKDGNQIKLNFDLDCNKNMNGYDLCFNKK
jgi:hypothetical protein